MTVTNRKMFNRGARNKVRQMGGIMASSEPLIQEVARFQPGGTVDTKRLFESFLDEEGNQRVSPETIERLLRRFGTTMPSYDRRADAEYLYNFSGDPFVTGGSDFILGDPSVVKREGLGQRNQLRSKPDIMAERDQLNRLQRVRNIAGMAKRAGFNLNTPIRNKDEVINFINQVDPSFQLTRESYDKIFAAESDPTIATKRGPTLERVLKSLYLLPVAATLDVGKGIGEALYGETKAYKTDQLRGLISGEMEPEPGEKINLANAALDFYQREVKAGKNPEAVAAEIKNISGFDINAILATRMRGIKDPTGILGVLSGESPGIRVADPEGLMASERAGQPPLSMTAADVRAAENRGIRAAEDALMQSRNIVDPQTSLGTDIQAVLRGVEEARRRQGDPLPRNQAEFEQIGADPDVEQATKIQQAINEAAKVKGDPLTEAQATEEKREAFPDPLTAEQKAELDKKIKELEAEAEKETDEAINTGDFSKVKDSYADLGRTYSDSKNPVDNPRLRRLIKEFTDNAPKYEGLDSGLALAKIGFMMAAGESPNAIVNIANALNKGADMFLEDDKKRKEFKRQVDFAGLQYGIGEISKLRAEGRAAAREGRKPLFFVADGPIEVDGVKYKDGDTVKLTMGYLLNNPLPKNLQHLEMAKASIKAEEAIKKASLTAASKKLMGTEEYGNIVDEITDAGIKFRSSNYLRNVLEANLVRTAENKITGFKPAFNSLIDSAFSAAGIDTPSQFTDKKKYDAQMADVANNLLEEILGESGKTISDNDRKILYNLVGLKTGVFGNVFDNKEVIGGKIQNVMNKLDEQEQRALNVFRSRLESTPGRTLGDDSLVYEKIQQYIPDVAKTQLMQGKITSPFNLVLGDDGVFRRAN